MILCFVVLFQWNPWLDYLEEIIRLDRVMKTYMAKGSFYRLSRVGKTLFKYYVIFNVMTNSEYRSDFSLYT